MGVEDSSCKLTVLPPLAFSRSRMDAACSCCANGIAQVDLLVTAMALPPVVYSTCKLTVL